MDLSHKYEVEREELKKKILESKEELTQVEQTKDSKEYFLTCVQSFAEMQTITPMILQALIDKIEVYAVEGTGKNRTQRIIIHYKFIGTLNLPELKNNIKIDTRQGVAVKYLTSIKTA